MKIKVKWVYSYHTKDFRAKKIIRDKEKISSPRRYNNPKYVCT